MAGGDDDGTVKRLAGIVLAALLVIGVVVVVALRVVGGGDDEPDARDLTVVRGVIGSEKAAFFADPRVRDRFAAEGLDVQVDPAGSRQIATTVDLARYGFAFPSSAPAAEKIQRDRQVGTVYAVFSTPMVIATFTPIVEILTGAGVVARNPAGYDTLDVGAYLDLVAAGTRWDQIPGNTAFPARRNVLVATTDPRDSNSAAMYLALTSYVANGEQVVSTAAAEQAVLPTMNRLFLDQGYAPSTTELLFEDYLSLGIGRTPMALVYESQFVDRVVRGDGTITDDRVLVYPAPTVFSTHTLVPLGPDGDRVGQLLRSDPELVRLVAEYGFRPTDPAPFAEIVADRGVPVAASLIDVVEPPAYDTLERLLDAVARQYE